MQKNRYLIIFMTVAVVTFAVLFAIRWLNLPAESNALNGGFLQEPITEGGVQTLIPSEYVLNTGLDKEQVPPLVNPVFTSVLASDEFLNDTTTGVSLFVDGEQRFYPVQILNYHYAVLDQDSAGPFVVTYCVFCRSGVVFNTDKKLRASEYVYSNNTLLEDEEGNLWHQMTGVGVRGDVVGETLPMRAGVDMLTWGDWKELYPNGRVLSKETGHARDYGRHPFGAYDENDRVYYPLSHVESRIPKKWLLNGAVINGQAIGFVHKVLAGFGVYQGVANETPYVAFSNPWPQVNVFSPVVDGQTLQFEFDMSKKRMTDTNTGTIWNSEGRATEGALAGKRLERLPSTQAMTMCWMSMYPESNLAEVPDTETEADAETETETETESE